MQVIDNLRTIQEKVANAAARSGRKPTDVTIVAVTKYVSVERAREAFDTGLHHLAENYLEGLLEKQESLARDAVWHFIGTLQSKKVKKMINQVDWLHSLDRLSLAAEIQKHAEKTVHCLVQINVSGEESKQGLAPEELKKFLQNLENYDRISVDGLMTMAPLTEEEAVIRICFRNLKRLQQEVQEMHLSYAPCQHLSMGMSNDFEIAVEEGATMVRIGSALVGSE